MTQDPYVFKELHVSCEQINQCSYSTWSKYFSSHIPPAKVLSPIPPAFIEYLNSDSIRLPPPKYGHGVRETSDNEYSDWEDDEDESSNPVAGFEEFDSEIQSVVDRYKFVTAKLNWSAPKDAKWILINNNIQCSSTSDIYMLLNASDHVAHDVDGHIYEECDDKDTGERVPLELVIKKWIRDINPALEFRIFVSDRKVLGVCQRELHHYQFLEDIQSTLHASIEKFQEEVLSTSDFPLKDYVMDVYIANPYDRVTILDINPFTRKWDSLLFTWHELLEKEDDGTFELRLITETNLGALARKDHSESQVPIEVVDASLNSEALVELAKTMELHDRKNEGKRIRKIEVE